MKNNIPKNLWIKVISLVVGECFLTTTFIPSYALVLEGELVSLCVKKTFPQAQGVDLLRVPATKDGAAREIRGSLSAKDGGSQEMGEEAYEAFIDRFSSLVNQLRSQEPGGISMTFFSGEEPRRIKIILLSSVGALGRNRVEALSMAAMEATIGYTFATTASGEVHYDFYPKPELFEVLYQRSAHPGRPSDTASDGGEKAGDGGNRGSEPELTLQARENPKRTAKALDRFMKSLGRTMGDQSDLGDGLAQETVRSFNHLLSHMFHVPMSPDEGESNVLLVTFHNDPILVLLSDAERGSPRYVDLINLYPKGQEPTLREAQQRFLERYSYTTRVRGASWEEITFPGIRDLGITEALLLPSVSRPTDQYVGRLTREALRDLQKGKLRILVPGSGAGVIPVALALANPEATIDTFDHFNMAVAATEDLIEQHGVSDRVHVWESDGIDLDKTDGPYDAIVMSAPVPTETWRFQGFIDFNNVDPDGQFTKSVLTSLPDLMTTSGIFYLLKVEPEKPIVVFEDDHYPSSLLPWILEGYPHLSADTTVLDERTSILRITQSDVARDGGNMKSILQAMPETEPLMKVFRTMAEPFLQSL